MDMNRVADTTVGFDPELLLDSAVQARQQAYAPYSHFRVGAALLTADGQIYGGCNIENAAYSPSLCAERVALSRAVFAGQRQLTALAICGGPENTPRASWAACWPCGVCRQSLSEFCDGDFPIYVAVGESWQLRTLGQLLPERFGPELLK